MTQRAVAGPDGVIDRARSVSLAGPGNRLLLPARIIRAERLYLEWLAKRDLADLRDGNAQQSGGAQ